MSAKKYLMIQYSYNKIKKMIFKISIQNYKNGFNKMNIQTNITKMKVSTCATNKLYKSISVDK